MAILKVRWSKFMAGWHYVLAPPAAVELCKRCRGTGYAREKVPGYGLTDEPCLLCCGTGLDELPEGML